MSLVYDQNHVGLEAKHWAKLNHKPLAHSRGKTTISFERGHLIIKGFLKLRDPWRIRSVMRVCGCMVETLTNDAQSASRLYGSIIPNDEHEHTITSGLCLLVAHWVASRSIRTIGNQANTGNMKKNTSAFTCMEQQGSSPPVPKSSPFWLNIL